MSVLESDHHVCQESDHHVLLTGTGLSYFSDSAYRLAAYSRNLASAITGIPGCAGATAWALNGGSALPFGLTLSSAGLLSGAVLDQFDVVIPTPGVKNWDKTFFFTIHCTLPGGAPQSIGFSLQVHLVLQIDGLITYADANFADWAPNPFSFKANTGWVGDMAGSTNAPTWNSGTQIVGSTNGPGDWQFTLENWSTYWPFGIGNPPGSQNILTCATAGGQPLYGSHTLAFVSNVPGGPPTGSTAAIAIT